MPRQQQSAAEIRRAIDEAITQGKRLSLQYLDTHLIVTPLSVAGEMLTTWADNMNRARQFKIEFIREAIVVAAAAPNQ